MELGQIVLLESDESAHTHTHTNAHSRSRPLPLFLSLDSSNHQTNRRMYRKNF